MVGGSGEVKDQGFQRIKKLWPLEDKRQMNRYLSGPGHGGILRWPTTRASLNLKYKGSNPSNEDKGQ